MSDIVGRKRKSFFFAASKEAAIIKHAAELWMYANVTNAGLTAESETANKIRAQAIELATEKLRQMGAGQTSLTCEAACYEFAAKRFEDRKD